MSNKQDKIVVTLGNADGLFEFGAFEVPHSIPFGGTQRLAVHDLVGGTRVIDSLGSSETDLSWSGLFLGEAALSRARYLDGMRVAGKELILSWSQFSYRVLISNLQCSFERTYKLPYSITCTTVANNVKPPKTAAVLSFDAAIMGDLNDANDLVTPINDSTLSNLMTTLNTAIKAVSSFANASQSVINSVLNPIQDVRSRVSVLTAAIGNTILNTTSFGGVFSTPSGIQNQTSKMAQATNLYQLDAKLQRMTINLNLIDAVPNALTVIVSGGNLFSLASKYYDDPSQWHVIAQANNLTDPVLTGTHTLTIPPKPAPNVTPQFIGTC